MKKRGFLFSVYIVIFLLILSGCNNVPEDKTAGSDVKSGFEADTSKAGRDGDIQEIEKNVQYGSEDTANLNDEDFKEGNPLEEAGSVYQPTIENPGLLFENMEFTKAYKSIVYHNPLMSQRFGADPYAMVYGDRVYVYMTNDIIEYDSQGNPAENTYSKIKTLNCISSDDLVNWTDHGTIKVAGYDGGSVWASNSWAPAAIHKKVNGKDLFYIYYANNASSIGVLMSDSPVGPFIDPKGKALITKQTENCSDIVWLFDPAVFTDDDGRSYLYFGGGVPKGSEEMPNTARVVELGEDMISLAGTPVVIEAPYLFEDSGINKIGDTYYYTYCSNWSSRDNAVGPYKPGAAEIIYMTSDSPLGPWQYQGSILKNPGKFFGTYGNNHHSIINFKDHWYIFYHTQVLADAMGIKGGYRSTHVDELTVGEDGSLQNVNASKFGVKQLKAFDPYQTTEAETFAWMGGIATKILEDSNSSLGKINNVINEISTGDWIGLSEVDFGTEGPKTFTARVSGALTGNLIRINVDKPGGEAIGYLEVPNTGSEDEFVEVTVEVSEVTGVHDLYFVFHGEGFLFDTWGFRK